MSKAGGGAQPLAEKPFRRGAKHSCFTLDPFFNHRCRRIGGLLHWIVFGRHRSAKRAWEVA
jgi:hypothetical protein